MNFCFVSVLEIDSIFVTFDFMAIQRGLEFLEKYTFVGIQIASISMILRYLHVSYMKTKSIFLYLQFATNHMSILKKKELVEHG